jgi:hypothetical protein
MKYLRKIFESENCSKVFKLYKPQITKDFALDFQDIFLEIEDYSNIFIEKSYYDNDDGEWKKIEDFSELSYNQYSISFYVNKPLPTSLRYTFDDFLNNLAMPKEIVIDMIECCKRVFQLDNKLGHTITYREFNRHQVTNEREISIDKIDSLIDKDIVSISITCWSF